MVQRVITSRERTLITYSEHWHSSRVFLKLGTENPRGSYHQFLGSIVFTAFAFEAFLNHVGEEVFTSWAELEKLSPKGKLQVIAERLEIEVNFGKVPWQIVPRLIGIRNKIAHGKNELLEDVRVLSTDDYDREMGEMLQSDWQKYSTQNNAEDAREKIEAICKLIWAKTEFREHELFQTGMQSGSTSLSPEA